MASMKHLGRLAFLLLGGLTLATCATNPATGKKELSFVSESQEIQIGQENAAAVKSQIEKLWGSEIKDAAGKTVAWK